MPVRPQLYCGQAAVAAPGKLQGGQLRVCQVRRAVPAALPGLPLLCVDACLPVHGHCLPPWPPCPCMAASAGSTHTSRACLPAYPCFLACRCNASRELLRHHQKCSSPNCPVCAPVKQYVSKQRQLVYHRKTGGWRAVWVHCGRSVAAVQCSAWPGGDAVVVHPLLPPKCLHMHGATFVLDIIISNCLSATPCRPASLQPT